MPVVDISFPTITEAKKIFVQVFERATKNKTAYRIIVNMQELVEIKPSFSKEKIPWDLQFTEKNRKAKEQAMKELRNGEALSYDDIMKKFA